MFEPPVNTLWLLPDVTADNISVTIAVLIENIQSTNRPAFSHCIVDVNAYSE